MRHRSQMMERCMRFMKECYNKEAIGTRFGSPEEMIKTMMSGVQKSDEMAEYAPTELRSLFEDWLNQLEEEIITFVKNREMTKPEDVAEAFKISKQSAVFILDKLARKEKINKDGTSVQKEDSNGSNG